MTNSSSAGPLGGHARKGPFISVGVKLAAATLVVLASVTALVYVGLSRFEHEKSIRAKEQAARMAGELFFRSVAVPVIFEDAKGIEDTVLLVTADPEVLGAEVWKATDQRVGDRLAAKLKTNAEPTEARWTNDVAVDRLPERIVLRGAIRDPDGKVVAIANVQYSLAAENQAYAEIRRQTLLFAAGTVVLLLLLLSGVSRTWITGPLGRLLTSVKQVESGARQNLYIAKANDEVGRLADAFGRMVEAVERREQDILRRNADMKLIMDNVAQGFLSVTRDGAVLPEHSAILESWFGPWEPGAWFWDYIGRVAPKVGATIEALWENVKADILPLEVAFDQLPNRIRVGPRTYALAFKAVTADADMNVLIVISDVTIEFEQEQAALGQQELLSIFQWMMKDRTGLLEYSSNAATLVRAIIEDGPKDLVVLKRDVHTLKGNSGVFGLKSLVAVCDDIESQFEQGAESVSSAHRDALSSVWNKVAERQAQLLGDGKHRTLQIEIEEQQALLSNIASGAPSAELAAQVQSWSLEPAQRRLARIGEQARVLAHRLEKGDITVLVDANGVRWRDGTLEEFWMTFAHLVRNAVDHGLESSAERLQAGKSPAGSLLLRTVVRSDEFVVEIEDDGRGIDWRKLKERALRAGLPTESRTDLVDALFADGISTKDGVTDVSGRGVGMSAVRTACLRSGGRVRVFSEPGEGTRFQFTWPASVLSAEPGVGHREVA